MGNTVDLARDRWGALAKKYEGAEDQSIANEAASISKQGEALESKMEKFDSNKNSRSDEAVVEVAMEVMELRNRLMRFCEITGKQEDIQALDQLLATTNDAAGISLDNMDLVKKPMPSISLQDNQEPVRRYGN